MCVCTLTTHTWSLCPCVQRLEVDTVCSPIAFHLLFETISHWTWSPWIRHLLSPPLRLSFFFNVGSKSSASGPMLPAELLVPPLPIPEDTIFTEK